MATISLIVIYIAFMGMGVPDSLFGAALNNYVALHYKASHMNFMQCFYGIGVSISLYLMSLPLWKRVKHNNAQSEEEEIKEVVPARQLLKNKYICMACMMCFAICGLESVCAGWGSTFWVEARNISLDITLFLQKGLRESGVKVG